MLNYIAIYLVAYLLTPRRVPAPGQQQPGQPADRRTARPTRCCWASGYRLHAGLPARHRSPRSFVWWLMERSTIGFRFRAVGANPHAARTAGISVNATYVWVMLTAGAFAGLAGSAQVLGTRTGPHRRRRGQLSGSTPSRSRCSAGPSRWARCFAGILFGALRAGGVVMQARTGTPDRHRARRAVAHRPVHRGPAAGPGGVPAAVTGHATRPEAGRPRHREGGRRMSAPTIDAPRRRPVPPSRAGPAADQVARADRLRDGRRSSASWCSGCSRPTGEHSTFADLDAAATSSRSRRSRVPSKLTAIILCLAALALAGVSFYDDAPPREGRCLAADHLRVRSWCSRSWSGPSRARTAGCR